MKTSYLTMPTPRETLKKCAELYCKIWREPPWNEDFWKPENVLQDISKELAEPFAQIVLTSAQNEIIGFTWGYQVSKKKMSEISGNNRLDFLFTENAKIFYIDELGVSPEFRQQGIGMKISRIILGLAKKDSAGTIVLRTDISAASPRFLYDKLGFKEIAIRDEKHSERSYWTLSI